MLNLISPKLHGVVDYFLPLAFLLAPFLFGFSPAATYFCVLVDFAHLALSLLTRYPLGLHGLVPFPLHGVIEGTGAVVMMVAPWLFAFQHEDGARFFCNAFGAFSGILVVLTRYQTTAAEEKGQSHHATEDWPVPEPR